MQDLPLDRSQPQGFRFSPIAVAITGLVLIFALVIASVAIAYRPLMARYRYSLGYTWNQRNEFDKAIAEYSEAIRLNPNSADLYRYRAFAWSRAQEQDKALADYTEAIRLEPNDSLAHNSVAWILTTCPDERIRDTKRAVESATKACELSRWEQPT